MLPLPECCDDCDLGPTCKEAGNSPDGMNVPGPAYCLPTVDGFGVTFFSGGRSFDQNVNSRYTSPQYLSLFISVNHSSVSPFVKTSVKSIMVSPMSSGSRGSSAKHCIFMEVPPLIFRGPLPFFGGGGGGLSSSAFSRSSPISSSKENRTSSSHSGC